MQSQERSKFDPKRQLSQSSYQKSPKSQTLTQAQLIEIQNDIDTFFKVTECLPESNQDSNSSAFGQKVSHFSPRFVDN